MALIKSWRPIAGQEVEGALPGREKGIMGEKTEAGSQQVGTEVDGHEHEQRGRPSSGRMQAESVRLEELGSSSS